MVLLRRVLGDALRTRRLDQDRTLRDVSTSANVSLGYLSEIERGQKEASSELLASICDALDTRLSEVLREAGGTMALAEEMAEMMEPADAPAAGATPAGADSAAPTAGMRLPEAKLSTSIGLSLERSNDRRRDVVCAA